MISLENEIEFDPGYGPYVMHFSDNIKSYMSFVLGSKAPHQRKFNFQITQPKISHLFENIVSFYQGCLLWAVFITSKFKDAPKTIANNVFLGTNPQDYDFKEEVDFLINYFGQFEKDCRYFLCKSADLPQDWLEIVKVYREFLVLNENFVNVKTTADIMIPPQIKTFSTSGTENIFELIQQAASTGELKNLLSIRIFES